MAIDLLNTNDLKLCSRKPTTGRGLSHVLAVQYYWLICPAELSGKNGDIVTRGRLGVVVTSPQGATYSTHIDSLTIYVSLEYKSVILHILN